MMASAERLISTARDYWPTTLEAYSHLDAFPQLERLRERWRDQLARMDPWWGFLDKLQEDLSSLVVWDITATVDASLRCAVYPRKDNRAPEGHWVVVGCMSVLAPVYSIDAVRFESLEGKTTRDELFFDSLPPEQQVIADVISGRLEATFEVSALPLEIARMPVPLCVEPHQPPETTLFRALFTGAPTSIP